MITTTDRTAQMTTSDMVRVSIDVDPKSVLHTSPEIFDDVENTFMIRYPNASIPTDIMAMAASPLILAFLPVRKSSMAHIIVTGITMYVLFDTPRTVATAMAPNATWERPSPINEKRLSTRVTPRRDEQSAISTPTITALCTKGWLRKNIGIVQQEPYLFSRTLMENIAIAMPDPGAETPEKSIPEETPEWNPGDEISETEEEELMTEEARMREIRRAAEIARLDETVERFADGYDTFVGERGVTLSGGQKQRAAIARMLVRRTPIMVFDDSLSAVDAETDAEIRRELRKGTSGATVILIAHRITTLQQADEIFVLENGRISEHGTHEQLVARGGHYSRVNALQTGGEME